MNHKRRRPKNRRAGCLMCKAHKMNGAKGEMLATKVKGIKGKIRLEEV
jgi:hypothetical protein